MRGPYQDSLKLCDKLPVRLGSFDSRKKKVSCHSLLRKKERRDHASEPDCHCHLVYDTTASILRSASWKNDGANSERHHGGISFLFLAGKSPAELSASVSQTLVIQPRKKKRGAKMPPNK